MQRKELKKQKALAEYVIYPYTVRMTKVDKPASNIQLEEFGEAEDLLLVLRPRQVVGPDENGFKKVIEYKFNEDGKMVKITTTTRVWKLAEARRLSKQAVERRGWAKFGDAVSEDVGARLAMVSAQEIALKRPLLATPLMVCTNCFEKGVHWAASCPHKFRPPRGRIEWPNSSYYAPENMRTIVERPPGSEVRPRNEENSVRVTNLLAFTREPDLLNLFNHCGLVTCVYVAIDQKTHFSKGYGFVTFEKKEGVEKAIAKNNGEWDHNLILGVEPWNV